MYLPNHHSCRITADVYAVETCNLPRPPPFVCCPVDGWMGDVFDVIRFDRNETRLRMDSNSHNDANLSRFLLVSTLASLMAVVLDVDHPMSIQIYMMTVNPR